MSAIRIILIGLVCFAVVSCGTTKSWTNKNDEKQAIETAKINTQLGMAYLEQKNVLRAKQKLLLALDEAPTIPETWYSMGYFLETTGNKAEANEYYLKSIALAPKRGDVQNNYGTYLCRTGKYKESIKHFLLATQDSSYLETASAYENAGFCALKIPDRHQAITYFKRAVAEDPDHITAASELARLKKNTG